MEYFLWVRLKGKVFINFNFLSIYDLVYCLCVIVFVISELGFKFVDVVFEIVEIYCVNDMNYLKGIFLFYCSLGFGVMFDDIGLGWFGLNLLE